MKKVLFIGNYRESSGYSTAQREYILSLLNSGFDVVTRPVRMTASNKAIDKKISDLENKDLKNVDVIIQHNLPSEFVHTDKCLNIGIFDYETSGLPNNDWISNLKGMHKVIVPCEFQKNSLIQLDPSFEGKTFVVPHAINRESTTTQSNFKLSKDFKSRFKFYTIAECTRRKDLASTILSYSMAFCASDNVLLVIKTHLPSHNEPQTMKYVGDLIQRVRNQSNLYANRSMFPRILVIPSYLSDEDLYGLHDECDVSISTSAGEAFCYPVVDGFVHGNPAIVPNHTAFLDYIKLDENGVMGKSINATKSPVWGVEDAPVGLYTSNESWYKIDNEDMAFWMKEFYDNRNHEMFGEKAKTKRRNLIFDYCSREVVGQKLKEIL